MDHGESAGTAAQTAQHLMHPAVALLEHQQALNRIARQARDAELALLPLLQRELRSMRYAMYTGAVLKAAEELPPYRPAGRFTATGV